MPDGGGAHARLVYVGLPLPFLRELDDAVIADPRLVTRSALAQEIVAAWLTTPTPLPPDEPGEQVVTLSFPPLLADALDAVVRRRETRRATLVRAIITTWVQEHGYLSEEEGMPQSPGMRPSKYQPLADHLVACSEDEIALTFTEIEAIIGGSLPVTAYVDASYWRATASNQVVLARLLGALGWRARLEQRVQRVVFTCEAP